MQTSKNIVVVGAGAIGAKLAAIIGAEMRRDAAGLVPAQLNSKGSIQRAMQVVSHDEEKRTVELAFSSETPVRQWFGYEILDHSPGAISMERMNSGAALLVDHNWSDQVGVVESVTVGADRKGRAVVRFGRSARAQEIFQDVIDGIRTLVSVGYRILDAVAGGVMDGQDVVRVTRWEPYEISLVSVPADPTVGVGRSMEKPQVAQEGANPDNERSINKGADATTGKDMNEKILRDASGNLVRALVNEDGSIAKVLETIERAGDDAKSHAQRGVDAERNRVQGIRQLGETYNQREMALEFIGSGKSPEDFQRALLEKMNARQNQPLGEQQRSATLGMSQGEIRNFSLFRAVRALLPNASRAERDAAAFEFECSQAAEKQYDKQARGILIPQDVLDNLMGSRAFNAGGAANTPVGATTGAGLVDTQFMAGSFIDMLRNRTTIMKMSHVMGGLVGNVDVPKKTGGATAYWVGEGQDATEGTPTIGQIGMVARTVGAYTDVTRRLMMQSTPDAESIVRADLLGAVAAAIDTAGYYGSGEGNEPRGIKNYSGINAVAFAGVQPTYPELVAMESAIAADNADVNSMAYVLNATGRGAMKTTPKFASGTDQGVVWEPGGTINGYRSEVTNQVANGDYFFGNFSDLVVGLWGGLDLTVDPYSLSKSGGTRIVVFQDVDFVLRRLESFCYGVKPAAGG